MKKMKAQPVQADPAVAKQISNTAMYISDMIQQAPPAVQTASMAIALSSLIIVQVRPGDRLKVFDKFAADMRAHIIHANSKNKKAPLQ